MRKPRALCREWAAVVPWAIAFTAGCAGFISPPGPVMPDRPGYTDVPGVLPTDAVELEVGYTSDLMGPVRYSSFGETLLRVGVGGDTEFRLFGNSYAMRTTTGSPSVSGMEDPKVGFKTSLRAIPDSVHSLVPNISLLAAVTLPFGTTGLTATRPQPEAKLAVNWTTPTPLSVYSNVGMAGVFDGSEWGRRGWVSVALWYAVNPKVSVVGEAIGARVLGGTALPSNNADAGITYLINDRFQVDLRAGLGFGAPSARERFVGAGFARRW